MNATETAFVAPSPGLIAPGRGWKSAGESDRIRRAIAQGGYRTQAWRQAEAEKPRARWFAGFWR